MAKDTRIRSGYRVIGHNTSNGDLSCWYFPTAELAHHFAKILCRDTGKEVDVVFYIGSWRPSALPIEFIPAKEEQQ